MLHSSDMATPIQPTLSMTLRGHHHGVRSVAFQPAAPHTHVIPNIISGGMDGAVILWDAAATARAVRFAGHRGPVLSVAQSSRPQLFASGGQDGYVRIWMPSERRTSSTYNAYPAGRATNSVCEWRAHTGATRAVVFAKDGSDRLYTIGDDKAVKSWDVTTMSSTHTRGKRVVNKFAGSFAASPVTGYAAAGHTTRVTALAVQCPLASSQFCHYVASGGDDGAVFVWDTRIRDAAHVVYGNGGGVNSLSFHPDGHVLASGDAAGDVNLFDLRRSSSATGYGRGGASPSAPSPYSILQHYHAAHMGSGGVGTTGVDFAQNGGWLLSCGDDGTVKLWDVKEGHLYCTVEGHDGPVTSCAFSHDASWFVSSGGADKTILVWRSGLAASCSSQAVAPVAATSVCSSEPLVGVDRTPSRTRKPPAAEARSPSFSKKQHGQSSRRSESALTDTNSDTQRCAAQRPPIPLAPTSAVSASLPHFVDANADTSVVSHHTDTSETSARERSFERCEERYSHLVTPPSNGAVPSQAHNGGSHIEDREATEPRVQAATNSNHSMSSTTDVVAREEQEQELLQAQERAHHRDQRDRIAEERVANLEDAVAALVAYMHRQQSQQEERMNALQAANKEQAERSEAAMAELRRTIALLASRVAPASDAPTAESRADAAE